MRIRMKQIRMVVACLLLAIINSADAQNRYYDAPNHLWEIMSNLEDRYQFISSTGQPLSGSYQPQLAVMANHVSVYAPDNYTHITDRIDAAYEQGGQILENIWQVDSLEHVIVFLVEDVKAPNTSAETILSRHGDSIFAEESIVIAIKAGLDSIETTFLHEYAHALQRMAGAAPKNSDYENTQRWYTEGSVQHAGLLTGVPDGWIDKDFLYQAPNGKGRFSQAYKEAHGQSLIAQKELASYFWYYYFMKVHSGSRGQYSNAIISYRENGFSHKDMSWFNFRDFWHDFALSHLNLPGQKTDIWDTLDPNFAMVTASARDTAEVVQLPEPFGDEVELKVLSQKYFSVKGLTAANDHIIFSLPDKEIPEGVEISAVLSRTDTGQETWEVVPITESSLGEHWFMRFPINGEAKLDADSNIPYNDIIFVVSNYSDTDEQKLNMVITNHLRDKYEGRGVELETGTRYTMTGTSILGVPRKGDGYRLVIEDDEIHTRALQAWFQRDPIIDFDQKDDLSRKALTYTRDNGVFQGDVYFKYIGLRPEKVEKIGGHTVESGKLIVNRERKENFYDTPNLFKIVLDQADLLIMFGADVKAATAFARQIEIIVDTQYADGTFGGTLSQLFQQTMAIDTRAYNQDYEVNYKRGEDDTGFYLKLRLGESMWFVLRNTQLAGFQKIIM
jgi:hypothetical protein